MTRLSQALLALAAGLLLTPAAWAHGVHSSVNAAQSVVFTLKYADGQPFAGAHYAITRGNETQPSVRGLTDGQGRIVFSPRDAGPWHLRARAADGHHLELTFEGHGFAQWEQTVAAPPPAPIGWYAAALALVVSAAAYLGLRRRARA